MERTLDGMSEIENLSSPWLVAVWPGMGSVATLAGSHLARSLPARVVEELNAEAFFEVQHVEVHNGLASAGRRPRNVVLLWKDPEGRRDLLIFVGEAQPDRDGYGLCQQLVERARAWGVERIVTFAAMATQLQPMQDPRVFAIGTDQPVLQEATRHGAELLSQGQISGLNGVLLAAAAEASLPGLCLMGEMPYFATQVPNPQAALAALEVFSRLSGVQVDFGELKEQSEHVQRQLSQLMQQMSGEEEDEGEFTIPEVAEPGPPPDDKPAPEGEADADAEAEAEPAPELELDPATVKRLEQMFEQADHDRGKAVELKQELDRLGVFKRYEDRFLDLFRKGG